MPKEAMFRTTWGVKVLVTPTPTWSLGWRRSNGSRSMAGPGVEVRRGELAGEFSFVRYRGSCSSCSRRRLNSSACSLNFNFSSRCSAHFRKRGSLDNIQLPSSSPRSRSIFLCGCVSSRKRSPLMTPTSTTNALKRLGSKYGCRSQIVPGENRLG